MHRQCNLICLDIIEDLIAAEHFIFILLISLPLYLYFKYTNILILLMYDKIVDIILLVLELYFIKFLIQLNLISSLIGI